VPYAYEIYCAGPEKNTQQNDNLNRKDTKAFFNLVFVEIIYFTRIGVLRGVFLANQLASTDN